MSKKLLCVLIIVSMLLTPYKVKAQFENNWKNLEDYYDLIVSGIDDLEEEIDLKSEVVEFVTSDAGQGNMSMSMMSEPEIDAIRVVRQNEDDGCEISIITPFTSLEDGTLVNSFELARTLVEDTASLNDSSPQYAFAVNATLVMTAGYTRYTNWNAPMNYMRPNCVYVHWTNNNSTIVTYLNVSYGVRGDTYSYPDALNVTDISTAFLDSDVYMHKYVAASYPVKGQEYISPSVCPSTAIVFRFSDYLNDGAVLSYTFNYNDPVTGQSGIESNTIPVLDKASLGS